LLDKYRYHLLLHAIILAWGFTGILGKVIELDALTIVWYRLLIAFVALGFYLYFSKNTFRIDWSQGWKIVVVGIIVTGHWLTFYYAIQLSTASLGVLCLSTTTLHVAWIEPIVKKRPFSWVEFLLSAVAIVGIFLIAGDFNPQETKAMYFGLLSALCAAMFPVFNAEISKSVTSIHITFYELIVGFVFVSILLMSQGNLKIESLYMTKSDFGWLLFLGIICTSFAFLMTIEIVKRLGAFTVSLSINLEPVYTIILAIIILKEHELLNFKFYIGAAVIVFTVLLNAYLKSLQTKKEAH